MRVRSLLNLIHWTGNLQLDFSAESFKRAYTRSKESQVSTNSPTLNIRIIEDKLSKSPR